MNFKYISKIKFDLKKNNIYLIVKIIYKNDKKFSLLIFNYSISVNFIWALTNLSYGLTLSMAKLK